MGWFIRFVCFLFLLLLLGRGHEAFAANTIGNTGIVVRTVTGTLSEGKRYLQFKDDIYRNETIETFDESATEVTFLDETTLSMGPNTKITLDRFIYDPEPENSAFVLTMIVGTLRFATGVLPSAAYKIHTPLLTIAIRGTVIDIVVRRTTKDDGTVLTSVNLTVVEGEADFVNCQGERALVPKGLSSTVEGTVVACSDPSAPGPQPPEITNILKVRDRLLAE